MVQWPLSEDPQAQWEAHKYDNPIPSRQYILQVLEQWDGPAMAHELAQAFGILENPESLEGFERRLAAMRRDGQLVQTRTGAYGLVAKMHLIQGTVQGHREGFGFLIPDDGGDDFYLSSRQMRIVFDGDRVLARETYYDKRGRRNASIVEVIERKTTQVVGQFYLEGDIGFVVPENKRIPHQIVVTQTNALGARHGQFVVADIIVPPDFRHQPQGRIVKVLGEPMASGMETDVAIHTHGIPCQWPEAVEKALSAYSSQVAEADKTLRVDLRQQAFVTIDGEDAKDFDDAVFCEPTSSGGWNLYVAIADVSHYVRRGEALDEEARVRGTSVYFPSRVIPMLPELLSNGLCSLNPAQDRLCLVCEVRIGPSGRVSRYRFMEAVIHSHARLTYTRVARFLSDQSDLDFTQEPVKNSLHALFELYQVLRKNRRARGAIDFETVETKIKFNSKGKIESIDPVERNEAHKIIEECMLLANVCAAKLLRTYELPALYRVHAEPKQEKLDQVNDFLASFGLQLPTRKKLVAKDYQKVLDQVRDRPDAHLVQTVLLRSMMQARYTEESAGHFGLAYPAYTHFTSPIRRYPDLVVHRAIRYLIRSTIECPQVLRVKGVKRLKKQDWLEISPDQLHELGEQCSYTERRADDATRDAVEWLKCEYMLDKVGQEYEGVISGVVPFGLFVELTDVYVEGLVHVTSLTRDYYTLDVARHCLVGERTRTEYALGETLRVRVASVNLEDRKIDFDLVDDFALQPVQKKKAKKSKNYKKRSGRKNKAKSS